MVAAMVAVAVRDATGCCAQTGEPLRPATAERLRQAASVSAAPRRAEARQANIESSQPEEKKETDPPADDESEK